MQLLQSLQSNACICKFWESKILPNEWKKGIDLESGNWSGNSVLSAITKILHSDNRPETHGGAP